MKKIIFVLLVIGFTFTINQIHAQQKKFVSCTTTPDGRIMKDGDRGTSQQIPNSFNVKVGDVIYLNEHRCFEIKEGKIISEPMYYLVSQEKLFLSPGKNYVTFVKDIHDENVIYKCYVTFRKYYVQKVWLE